MKAAGAAKSCFLGFALTAGLLLSTRPAVAADGHGVDFFEQRIRPLLTEHCYSCHSAGAKKVRGSLLLDTREGLLKGGDSGPAITPGDPERSLLIKAVRYTDENLQMPPKGKKLSPQQVEDLTAWVSMGAPDPRSNQVASRPASRAADHWAFRPVREPDLPAVRQELLVTSPIDRFLLARLEREGLSFSPRADRRALIRRATYDLLGLPPDPEEVWAFETNPSPLAFAQLVERLLESPRYGERWGRYWLDIARYADTKGYLFEEERRYPYSYTYRDWVIRAFNEDLPYDQFLIQQIAADLLPLGDDQRALAALGFLTLGRRFLNNQPDIIDDRIDVVTRGMMGLTVGCARCHDHKFDPIPSQDYYSLYGVFASCHEPAEGPLLGAASRPRQYAEYEIERKKREQKLTDYRAEKDAEVLKKVRAQVGDYLLVLQDGAGLDEEKQEGLIRERKLEPALARHYRLAIKRWQDKTETIMTPWFELVALPATNFSAPAQEWSARLKASVAAGSAGPGQLAVAPLFSTGAPPASLKEVAGRYNRLFAEIDREWREGATNTPPLTRLPDANREALRQILYGSNAPIMALTAPELHNLMDTPVQQKLRALKREADGLDVTHPGAPPRAMALLDNASPTEPVVFKRGNPNTPGDKVPRQFLQVLAGPTRKPFARGSGRLDLAEAIASTNNALTARVFVNRVWRYHFGTPLVRTTSDFGLRAEPPTHPELLDYLAARFMAGGWSIKNLHRLMMLSAAYQQGDEPNSKAVQVDPANQLFGHMNRRRLDFEAMRDTLLAIAGTINLASGGRAVDLVGEPYSMRRTVYGFVERQNLPGLFRTFDFASPDTTSPHRFSTTVPQQALFLMNSPFVIQQAKALVDRPELKSIPPDQQPRKIRELYRIVFQRSPDSDELKMARTFLEKQSPEPTEPEPAVWSYGYGRFNQQSKRVEEFAALTHWTGYAWQGGTNLPDTQLGWVLLNADGGHPGNDEGHAAVRRWRAPADGTVAIQGELRHPSEKGDGVRGRLVSSRAGVLGEWVARNGAVATALEHVEVKRGDFLDFIVDCRASVEFDSFIWAPVVAMSGHETKDRSAAARQWNAKLEFAGPQKPSGKTPLNVWEKYAQVLLLANEVMFVD